MVVRRTTLCCGGQKGKWARMHEAASIKVEVNRTTAKQLREAA
jgi:hypothetical protein